nr:hypothetical protein [Tanacetum cinerariifolium]
SEVHTTDKLPLPRYGLDAPPARAGLSDGYDWTIEYVRYSSCLLGLTRWVRMKTNPANPVYSILNSPEFDDVRSPFNNRSSYLAFLRTNYQASAIAFLRVPSLISVALLVALSSDMAMLTILQYNGRYLLRCLCGFPLNSK